MIHSLFILIRVFLYQLLEKVWGNNILNYTEELQKTKKQFKELTDISVSRTTNDIGTLFRSNKKKHQGFSIDNLVGIIKIDVENKTIDVGGKTRFYDILNYTLKHRLMPQIVPELSSITVGGAICGISIESSSFKYGWVHDTIIDMDILTSTGEVLYCTRTNENKDLFNSIPNSYGTIGYVTRAKIQLVDSKKAVKLSNHKFDSSEKAFSFIKKCVQEKDVDFIDAVAYDKNDIYVVLGRLTNSCITSSYPRDGEYYKSITKLTHDILSIYDYYWRWDADMFWGVTGVNILKNKWFRWIFGRCFLNTRVLRATQRVLQRKSNDKVEKIIQDLGVPDENVVEFYNWVCDNISEYPIWICPVVPKKMESHFWTFNDAKLYFDIGVFVRKKTIHQQGYYNKLIEKKLLELDGNKCFYSDTFLTKPDFDKLIDPIKFKQMKEKYDPNNRFGDLYEKIIHCPL